MTPHKANKRGTFRIDKVYRGIGRICQSSGTTNQQVFERVVRMLDDIARSERADLLKAVKDRRIHPLRELYPVFKARGIKGLPSLDQLKPLRKTFDTWVKQLECSEKHRQQVKYVFDALGIKKSHTVADLPMLFKAYRASPSMWNHARAYCQAFARDTTGRYSDVWLAITNCDPRKTARRQGKPQTPQDAERIRLVMDLEYGAIWWAMCITGMGPDELGLFPPKGGDWEVLDDRVVIHGTKREARDRVVPLIETPERPTRQYRAFWKHLKPHGVQPYDGRRTFAHWLEMAKIPKSRIEYYLGHKAGRDVTSLYTDHDVGPYIAKDRRAIKGYLRRELSQLRLERPA